LRVQPHGGAPGERGSMSCETSTVHHAIPAAAFETALRDPAIARHGLRLQVWLEHEQIGCSMPWAIGACIESPDGSSLSPLGPSRYALSGPACLAGGTPIRTPEGDVAIEALRPGHAIVAYDHHRGQLVVARVQRVRTREESVARIELVDGTVLEATAEHLFYRSRLDDYRPARELVPGAGVWTANGEVLVKAMGGFEHAATVYDLSVDGPSNYFAAGVLVHNY
ncbi:MAG: Hint domain-containing protein, partial [Myxococcota bacterium]